MAINWYPGHMVKARREIEENIKLVDMVIMLLDARAPFSCRNPDLEKIASRKKLVLVLNKMDLADKETMERQIQALKGEGHTVAAMDSLSGKGAKQVLQVLRNTYQEKAREMRQKGRRVRPARVMVTGVPNVGKSTFLNSMVGQKAAKTGDKPGVTKGKQWLRIREDMEFMDTPGLMWPRLEAEEQGLKLALLNIVGEHAYDEYEAALYLVQVLKDKVPQALKERYKVELADESAEEVLREISRKRGHLVAGGEPDVEKTSRVLLQEFRKGSLGRISLDD